MQALLKAVALALATLSASAAVADERRSPRFGFTLRRRADRRAVSPAFMTAELAFKSDTKKLSGSTDLLQFRGKGDDYCAFMDPLTTQLCKELGVSIRCFEVWYDSRNLELLQKLDGGRCNGVPFFYNKRSKRFICGATTYENLKSWALGQTCEPFLPPPELEKMGQEENGVQNKVQEIIGAIKLRGMAMMEQRSAEPEPEPAR